ncbi:MAG: hypothetical protein BRD49_01405, partial [Bacteroidetes bacterium SW_10_40_5]
MHRKAFLILICNIYTAFLQAQTFEWANKVGGDGQDIGRAIVSDSNGNTFFTGRLNDTVIFANDTLSDNIYITGEFSDTTVFKKTDTLIPNSSNDLFIAKYDTAGNFKWAIKRGSSGSDAGFGLAFHDSFIYVGGKMRDSAYLAKFDDTGNNIWEVKANGNSSDEIKGVDVGKNRNIYCTGGFRNKLKIGNDSISSSGGQDVLLAKFDSSGNVKTLKSEGGYGTDKGRSLSVSENAGFFLTGNFIDSATFGINIVKGKSKFSNGFVAYYDAQLNLKWIDQVSGKGLIGTRGNEVVSCNKQIGYVIGRYQSGDLTFQKDTISNSGGTDVFILKVNKNGKNLFSFGTGGTNNDEGSGIAVDKEGNSYFTGQFKLSTKFGNNNLTSNGVSDIFVTKLSDIRIFQDTIPDTTLCAGQRLQVPFTVEGDFDPGNTFTAQLSNDTGNFDNP